MEKLQVLLLVVLAVCGSTFATFESILDLSTSDCSKAPVTENICISPNSPEIASKKRTRTDVECLMGCKSIFDCAAVFKDNEDNCYEMSTSQVTQISKDVGVPTGNLYSRVATGNRDDCSGSTCPADNICFKGCSGEVLSDPICVADGRENCKLGQEFTNARHYYNTDVGDGRDSGNVWLATYPKIREDSGIRVIMHTNVRGHHNNPNYCHHWYVTFDGSQCTDPANIEQLDYSATTGDYHAAMDIDGICYGFGAGNVQVNLYIDRCDGYASTDGYTGWNSPRTMIIMEVLPQQQVQGTTDSSCPLSAVFNHKYESWIEEIDDTYDTSTGSHLIKAITYEKLASDTSLRIKYATLMSVKITNSGYKYCGRWFVKINGTECDPILDTIIFHDTDGNTYGYWRHHRRVETVEGICDNVLAAGTYSIEVYTGRCYYPQTEPTNFITGGFNSPSRMYIEEVRKEHSVDGLYSSGSNVYRSMTGNLQRWHYENLDNDDNSNVILTLTYEKQFADTALRLTSSGVHRTMHCCGYERCVKWYFTIDNLECTDPGNIFGVIHFYTHTDSHHPIQISGMCHGIDPGSRIIRYGSARCPGYGTDGDAYTGWGSSFHVFAEELRTDLTKTCSGNPVNCGGP